ncbi:hypothetical protein KDL45_19385, partial [bacterium]|nr:hypothetical protein [bacterium]
VRERLKKRMDSPLKFNPKSRLPIEPFENHPVAAQLFAAIKSDPGRPLAKFLGDLKDKSNHDTIGAIFGLLTMGVLRFGLTEQRKRKVVERRRAARAANDPFQKLFAEAAASVDRIHEEAKHSQQSGGVAEGDEATQLRARLDKLMETKRQQREILAKQMAEGGEPAGEE